MLEQKIQGWNRTNTNFQPKKIFQQTKQLIDR